MVDIKIIQRCKTIVLSNCSQSEAATLRNSEIPSTNVNSSMYLLFSEHTQCPSPVVRILVMPNY